MSSLFNNDPGNQPAPSAYSRERIEKEIGHLDKRTSVRHAEEKRNRGRAAIIIAVLAFVSLYLMDPIVYSFARGDAIRAYLYLHHYGSDRKAQEILATGMFDASEIDHLNRRQGSFQNYFSSPPAADQAADKVLRYLKGVSDLHEGHYEHLDILGKIRYQLFVRWGLDPPMHWRIFDPSVNG
jgi:hypothetical protein